MSSVTVAARLGRATKVRPRRLATRLRGKSCARIASLAKRPRSGLPAVVKLGLACPHPEGLSGEVHRTNGARVCSIERAVVGGVGYFGALPEPPAAGTDLTLVCLSLTLHRGATHTRAATRPLAPPRHLSWGPVAPPSLANSALGYTPRTSEGPTTTTCASSA